MSVEKFNGSEQSGGRRPRFRPAHYPSVRLRSTPREAHLIDSITGGHHTGPTVLANLLLRLAVDLAQPSDTGVKNRLRNMWQGPDEANRALVGFRSGELVVSATFHDHLGAKRDVRAQLALDGNRARIEGRTEAIHAASGEWWQSDSGVYWPKRSTLQPSDPNRMARILHDVAGEIGQGLKDGSLVPQVQIQPGD